MSGPRTEHGLLAVDEVDVWYVHPDAIQDPELLDRYRRLMSPAEQAQELRYIFAADRHLYRVGKALVRTALSRYVDRDPASWSFIQNRYGRPELGPGENPHGLRFNLSHTAGLVACAVARGRDVGVDVEDFCRRDVGPEVAEHYFSPDEVAALFALPVASRQRGFFNFWTLKEAYIKARGMGLSLPLEQFSFHLGGEGSIAISFSPAIEDNPVHWQFVQLPIAGRYLLATAAGRSDGEQLTIAVRETVPVAGN